MSGGPIGEKIENQPAAQGDFNRTPKPATSEALVAYLTTYVSNLCGCASEMTVAELLHHLACSPRHCSCAERARAEQARLQEDSDE